MMAYGESLLSKICDNNAVEMLDKYGIERDHFSTETERAAYDFIRKYASENGGNAPSYAALVSDIPDIEYVPDVSDRFRVSFSKIKGFGRKTEICGVCGTGITEIIPISRHGIANFYIDRRTGKY